MNKVFLIGRLTKDPDLRYLANNTPVASFSLAVSRPFENQSGQREADFINVVVWRKQAENIKKYLTKGSQIAVDGRIQTRNYDGQDGKKVYVTEVVADNVQFLDSKAQREQNNVSPQDFNNNNGYEEQAPNTTDVSNDPFAEFGDNIELSEDDIAF